jgi:hypothetical protein
MHKDREKFAVKWLFAAKWWFVAMNRLSCSTTGYQVV